MSYCCYKGFVKDIFFRKEYNVSKFKNKTQNIWSIIFRNLVEERNFAKEMGLMLTLFFNLLAGG